MHEGIKLEALGQPAAQARLQTQTIITAGPLDLSLYIAQPSDKIEHWADRMIQARADLVGLHRRSAEIEIGIIDEAMNHGREGERAIDAEAVRIAAAESIDV